MDAMNEHNGSDDSQAALTREFAYFIGEYAISYIHYVYVGDKDPDGAVVRQVGLPAAAAVGSAFMINGYFRQ